MVQIMGCSSHHANNKKTNLKQKTPYRPKLNFLKNIIRNTRNNLHAQTQHAQTQHAQQPTRATTYTRKRNNAKRNTLKRCTLKRNTCKRNTRHKRKRNNKKLHEHAESTLSLPPSPLAPTPPPPRTSAHSALLCPLKNSPF